MSKDVKEPLLLKDPETPRTIEMQELPTPRIRAPIESSEAVALSSRRIVSEGWEYKFFEPEPEPKVKYKLSLENLR